MTSDIADDYQATAPFEGPEKLLEIWFAPSALHLPDSTPSENGKLGLRSVDRQIWEDMLDIVKCKVLSVIEGEEMDAYLLSESSFFVAPHRLILKTCGTTLNLLGLPRILEIAAVEAHLTSVYRCFYSRKSFMFPERQLGPHRDWKHEVEYLDSLFENGAAYTVGKVNGDHWLLYMTAPPDQPLKRTLAMDSNPGHVFPDYTIEILMSGLSPAARAPFFTQKIEDDSITPSLQAQTLSQRLGISSIFPPQHTTLDAYAFFPCGYSSNALIEWNDESSSNGTDHYPHSNGGDRPKHSGEGYYTIHVTPEEGWSYASFECNVPLSASLVPASCEGSIPDLKSLVQRVVKIFQPNRLTVTLFISSRDNNEGEYGESAVEAAQRAFKKALAEPVWGSKSSCEAHDIGKYKRTDKINYEFGGYDLAFSSFELE